MRARIIFVVPLSPSLRFLLYFHIPESAHDPSWRILSAHVRYIGQIDTIQTQIITKPYTRPRILLFNPTRYSLALCRVWCTKIATCLIRGQSRLKFAWTLRSELWALCQLFGVKFVLESVKGVLGRSTSILASRLSKPAGTNYFSKISSVWWWWRGEERGEGLAWLVKNRKELSGNEGGREEAAELVIGFRSWNRD